MGTLVVTTDFSELSRRALPVARRMADGLGVQLVLLHVVHAPALAPALSGSIDLDVADAEKGLTELAKDLGDVTTKVIEAEEVVPALVGEATTADMLVMASHGRTGLKRLALGSVVEAVLEAASTPVLCVPAGIDRPDHGTRVVVASDLSAAAAEAFPMARRLAQGLALPLTLLVVEDPKAPIDRSLLEPHAWQLRDGGPSVVTTEVVTASDVADAVVSKAKLDDAAVLCTAASPKSALERVLLGSVSRQILRAGSVPVAVVPAR